jgi:hypothetical protein
MLVGLMEITGVRSFVVLVGFGTTWNDGDGRRNLAGKRVLTVQTCAEIYRGE